MSLYAVVDPATGDVVKEYPTATDQQIEAARGGGQQGTPASGRESRRWPSAPS